jgi:hypothetical protein
VATNRLLGHVLVALLAAVLVAPSAAAASTTSEPSPQPAQEASPQPAQEASPQPAQETSSQPSDEPSPRPSGTSSPRSTPEPSSRPATEPSPGPSPSPTSPSSPQPQLTAGPTAPSTPGADEPTSAAAPDSAAHEHRRRPRRSGPRRPGGPTVVDIDEPYETPPERPAAVEPARNDHIDPSVLAVRRQRAQEVAPSTRTSESMRPAGRLPLGWLVALVAVVLLAASAALTWQWREDVRDAVQGR